MSSKQSNSLRIITIIAMMFLYAMIAFVTNLAAPVGKIWEQSFEGNHAQVMGMLGNMMNFYNGTLPGEEPIKIFAFADIAWGGGDYTSVPIAYQYSDGSVFIHDVVFDQGDKNITIPKVVDAFIRNNVGSACFEGTKATAEYKEKVDSELRKRDFRANIMLKAASTRMRKEERIFEKSPEIREFYFRDTAHRSNEYAMFMRVLHSFTMNGKNRFDDSPDSLAGLADMVRRSACKPRIIDRPF